jgi:protein-S-isoprenylcysteine O-methyltransferase Ste14
VGLRDALERAIRPSTTRSTGALWAKSLLNAVLFFCVFMLALPWLAQLLLPLPRVVPAGLSRWPAAALFVAGLGLWIACLDTFSRRGRGTPLPMDAPRELVTTGPFGVIRNPIMAGELLVIWGEALWLGSLGVVLYALLISAGAAAAVRLVEEPELHRRFGAGYQDYCSRVPRWLPRPGGGRRRAPAPPETR